MWGTTLATVLGLAVATAAAGPTDASSGQAHPQQQSRAAMALDRLRAEAQGAVHVSGGPNGLARVVGVDGTTPAPDARAATTPRFAARAQLARYGALVGVDRPGTRLVRATVQRTATGDRIVRYTQRRDGIPVVAGAVAVGLHPDGSLSSIASSVSTATVPEAAYPRAAARREALTVVSKELRSTDLGSLHAGRPVRRLFDPAVLGVPPSADPATQARGVWWVD